MVTIVTSANRHLHEVDLRDMHRLRYHVAVNELGWTLPDGGDGVDIDRYDRDDTIYFLHRASNGELIATARLNPTTRPHLMTDIFPDLCSFDGVPMAEDIYEYSRFLVKRRGVSRRENLRGQACISLAIVEYCLAADIRQVSWVSYKRSYPLALRMWVTRPLGLPQYFEEDDADYIAAISDMNSASLQKTRDLARIYEPVGHITVELDFAPDLAKRSETPNKRVS